MAMQESVVNKTRREFLKKTVTAGAGAAFSFSTAASYSRIIGANDRINLGFAGVRSRGRALIGSAVNAGGRSAQIHSLCDVDSRALARLAQSVSDAGGGAPKVGADFRNMIEDREIDAVVIATPDHTHTPFSIYALQQGKHVYVEKPCSHNPREGELLAKAALDSGLVVQMGNQQRSAPTSIEIIQEIHEGIIGRAYMGKAWYSNNRGSIGEGSRAAVPDWLDWELWQGPAPRQEFKDNYVHYNWHWFEHWGTGEINNNGLHELDVCRWALDVDLPHRVKSTGGRFHFDDDWEFPDTQIASFEYADDKMISWDGRSCNKYEFYERGRGATIHGTEGTVLLDRNGYRVFDNDSKLVKQANERDKASTTQLRSAGALVDYHIENFFAAIREGEKLRSPIDEGARSTLLCHLGNIAQKVDRVLNLDPDSGRILDDEEAMSQWSREYENGWSPEV